jgi:hypothetical protein
MAGLGFLLLCFPLLFSVWILVEGAGAVLGELDCFELPEVETPVACLFVVLDFVFVASGF